MNVNLKHLNSQVDIYFNLIQNEELEISKISFKTNLEGEYLGILVAFIELLKGKPIDVLDRIGPKELDYFCRDNNSTSAFEFYTPELYEVLSIGEEISKSVKGKKVESEIFDKEGMSFVDYSYSEQIEFFEEFCSRYIYQNPKFKDIYFDFEDCSKHKLVLTANSLLSDEMKQWIETKFNEVFGVEISLQV